MRPFESKIAIANHKRTTASSPTALLVAATLGLLLAFSAAASAADRDGQRAQTQSAPRDKATGAAAGGVYTGVIETAYGTHTVSYQILKAKDYGLEEDIAVFEGDIVLTKIMKPDHRVESAGRVDTSFRWPDGVVPFEISSAYTAAETTIINNALNHWNANTPYWFRPRNGESDFIRFVRNTGGVCSSPVGRQGGQQSVNLDANACGTGAAIHEIGHAIGLYHEQSRADRDTFVTINFNNIQTNPVDQRPNFQTYIQRGQDGRDMFDYDFNSIMHYSSFAFAKLDAFGNPVGPTITKKDGTLINANRTALSTGDIAGAVRVLTNTQPQSTFELVNVNSGKCLDVANWSRTPGAAVNQFTCHGGANQRWYFWRVPGTNADLIINDWSGQCLDIPGGSLADGAQLQQFPCHGFGNQQYTSAINFFLFSFRFRNVNSSKCLDIPNASTASGVRVQQFTCHSGLNQQWTILP